MEIDLLDKSRVSRGLLLVGPVMKDPLFPVGNEFAKSSSTHLSVLVKEDLLILTSNRVSKAVWQNLSANVH